MGIILSILQFTLLSNNVNKIVLINAHLNAHCCSKVNNGEVSTSSGGIDYIVLFLK